jgi:hypothetical protein
MNHHNAGNSDAQRLARAAARMRHAETQLAKLGKASAALEVSREATRLEGRALKLAGYRALPALGFLLALLVPSLARAEEPKAARAIVCVNFEVVVNGEQAKARHTTMLGVCRDGKRPRLFQHWMPVVINDGERDHSFVVGLP